MKQFSQIHVIVEDKKVVLGGIQQLRGQDEGEGGSAKSPRLSTQGGGRSLECPRGPKPSYFRRYFILLSIMHSNGW